MATGALMDRFATIVSTGSYLPETQVSNDELRKRFAHLPGFVDKMEESSSIRCRWYAPDDWASSDLALPAARQALERAGVRPEEVDLIILGTDSPDYITPATSVVLQHKLGAVNAGTFDIVNNSYKLGLYPANKYNFSPRIGLAYEVNEKTSIHAGFGTYFYQFGYVDLNYVMNDPSYITQLNSTQTQSQPVIWPANLRRGAAFRRSRAASLPASGSVREKAPIHLEARSGRYLSFCASVPNIFNGMPKRPLEAPQDRNVEAHAAATSSPAIAWLIKSRFVPP